MDREFELKAIGETLQEVETSLARHEWVTDGLPELERDRRAQVLETRRKQLEGASERLKDSSGIEPGEVVRRADHVVAEAVLRDVVNASPDANLSLREIESRTDWQRHYGYACLNGLPSRIPGVVAVGVRRYRNIGGPAFYDVLVKS